MVDNLAVEARLYDVIRHVRPLHAVLADAVTLALAGRDVTLPMRAVLETLHDGGPQTVPAVARTLGLTRQFVQRVVDACAGAGLVEDAPNPAHRRSPLVSLTTRGAAEIEDVLAGEAATLRRVADGLDPDDVEACLRVLDHLRTEFTRFVEGARP